VAILGATIAIELRELKNRATEILRRIQERGRGLFITRDGKPAALILPIDSPEAEDYVLSHVPEIVKSLRAAEGDLRGARTISSSGYRKRRGL
jgi:prevent-host-death family protein